MNDNAARSRVVDDHMFEIHHLDGTRQGTCRLQLFTAPGQRAVAVASWVPGDGCSLTNCAEVFASEAWRRHLPDDDQPPIWIQHQALHSDPDPGFQVVTFQTNGRYRLSGASWRRISAEDLAELVGSPVDPRRGEGFTPPAEPVQRVRYTTRWVMTLPPPQPFRAECMPGISFLARLGRQLVARRTPRSCCWYHGGDWAQVSRTAIRLVREAQASDVDEDDVEDDVMARAEAEGITGWQLDALRSLVEPTDGIFIDRDGRRLFYINGQHRARAMIDTGVRRTLTVAYWEEEPT